MEIEEVRVARLYELSTKPTAIESVSCVCRCFAPE